MDYYEYCKELTVLINVDEFLEQLNKSQILVMDSSRCHRLAETHFSVVSIEYTCLFMCVLYVKRQRACSAHSLFQCRNEDGVLIHTSDLI